MRQLKMVKVKGVFIVSVVFILSLVFIIVSDAEASTFETQSVYGGDITSSFSSTMLQNAAYMAFYAMVDQDLGTYPFGTGFEFAEKVKTGGPWDYKLVFTGYYLYN